MHKIQPDGFGYKLSDSTSANPDNIEELGKEQIQELLDTNASIWDMLMMRKSHHNLINAINDIMQSVQIKFLQTEDNNLKILNKLGDIEERLYVEYRNGDLHKEPMSKVVGELAEMHEVERRRDRAKSALAPYRKHAIIVAVISFALALKFHDNINAFLKGFEDWTIILSTSAIVVTILSSVIKAFVETKIKRRGQSERK